MFSYKPLFVLLAKKGLTKTQLRIAIGIGPGTLAKLSKNEYVSMEVLDKICSYLQCSIEDVIEHVPDTPLKWKRIWSLPHPILQQLTKKQVLGKLLENLLFVLHFILFIVIIILHIGNNLPFVIFFFFIEKIICNNFG